MQQQVQGPHHDDRQQQHRDLFRAEQEGADLEGAGDEQGREGIGALGQEVNRDLFELHPDHEARDHGRERGVPAHGTKAQALDINAGEDRACQRRQGDDQHVDLVMHMQPGAGVGAQHDGGAECEVQPAHDAENDGEADRQQRVGRAEHDAVNGILDEIDHSVCPWSEV